ncbi:MAG TPA: PBP1A family penicillin-binding protein, partial [Thermoanaerobaculia bacterium]|nr:PBP1A family penicillin-binding protein [Thermoanaerobaculia bacterium]
MMRRLRNAALLTLAIPIYLALVATSGLLFKLDRQMSAEMRDRPWREPTRIVSKPTGKVVASVYGTDWRVTTPIQIDQMPEHVTSAFIAAEDVRFRKHFGIDLIGIMRALLTNVRAGAIEQGGSTIHQQLIKAKYLHAERTYRRKFLEILLAARLDFRFSKDEVLEAYLNDVYLGHHNGRPVLGVDEAARLFFDKTPSQLRVDEAALLAGIIRAPNRDTPDKRPERARTRRDAILRTMQVQGWIDEDEYRRASRRPVQLRAGQLPRQPYPFYLAALRAEILAELGQNALRRSGLEIIAEIHPVMQQSAEESTRSGLRSLRSRHSWLRSDAKGDPLQVALLSVDPATGGIRALVGGSNPAAPGFDRTLQMKRQPGSAFKTFAYLAAINSRKYTPASFLLDTPLRVELAGNQTWEPRNYDERFRGRVTVRESFEKSLNVPTIRMTDEIGNRRVIRTARDVGFATDFPDIPALPLGVGEVSLRELTGAYTIFPNLGNRVTPFLLSEVRDREGTQLFRREPEIERVVDPAPAYIMHSLLRGVVRQGPASRLGRYGLSHVAGKTGTTNDYRDAWFVGYTPELVTTVWVGFDRGSPLRLSSAEAALPIWGTYMRDVPAGRKTLEVPEGLTEKRIDPESGYLWAEGCPGPVREVFLDGTAPSRRCPRGFFGKIARDVLFESES